VQDNRRGADVKAQRRVITKVGQCHGGNR